MHRTRLQLPGLLIASAGTRAVIGEAIHPKAAAVLGRLGGDPDNFRARQLTPTVAAEADLVLTMSFAHRDSVLELAPRLLRRTFTLAEAGALITSCGVTSIDELADARSTLSSGEVPDVPDPMGHDERVFERVGVQIADLLPPVMELCRLSCS